MQPYPQPTNKGVSFTKIRHHDTYDFINPASKSNHEGHYVFITGASKGVGKALAISFARAGAAGIALGARSDLSSTESELLAAAKEAGKPVPKVLSIPLDVTSPESVGLAAKEIATKFPKLDILINNAGYLSPFVPILDSDPDEYWMNYEVNLHGTYLVTKSILPFMIEKGGEKTVVNVSSAGAHGVLPGGSAYQTTKFALLRFTEYLCVEYGDKGVLAWACHPTGAMTEMGKKMPESFHHMLQDTVEIASDTMCFLTAEKREWLAGRYVDCCWDMEEFLGREKEIVNSDKLKMRMVF